MKFDNFAGSPNYGGMGWHVFADDECLSPYFRVIADSYRAKDGCGSSDNDVVPDGRVPLPMVFSGSPKSNVVVHDDILADNGGLADDYSHPMINEKAIADFCPWMDFDARKESSDLGDEPRKEA